ncbi:M48 family metallopeptidase [Marinilabilia sp.]|uniref:M48 family metallopeptidase n=1 Tax=Marinilabilia sp. TaxID=2021252 RepID=UPI0025C40995|nr:SprT family zinc-dependent metalloprotease [Marinilabilia sp.]
MSTQTSLIDIDGIGPVLFRSDARCRRLSIRLKPFEGVVVLFPSGYSIRKALTFVEEKRFWIQQNQSRMAEHEQMKTIFNEQTEFRSRTFQLRVERHQSEKIRMRLKDGILRVAYPRFLNVTDARVQTAIRQAIEEGLRLEAKAMLPGRVRHFAGVNGFKVNKVFIKNLKSRWGSCSSVNNINLNLQLMRLPQHLIDYVVLHELCHTKEKNHGPGFWKLMNKVTDGNARLLDKEMKKYRTTIY